MRTYLSMCGICDVQNEEVNGHYKNTEFKCADVTALDLKIPEASADIVFSNWLLMYLSDDEVETTPIPPPPSLCVCVSLWLKHYVLQTVCFLLTGNQSVL